MIEFMQQQDTVPYFHQFKNAMMLSPQVDDDGQVIPISMADAALHFLSIGWKALFSVIPPARWAKGWLTFFVALFFIGVITAVVGEVASLFGCVLGIKDSVTAITFVALGTSLPDTFASKTAAQEAKNADSAIGNVTGSNSVNVFLGLGLPWIIGSVYYMIKGDPYKVPSAGLSFSVLLFLATSTICLITIVLKRIFTGGELGGKKWWHKLCFSVFFVFLWLIYIVFSTLMAYDAFGKDTIFS